MKRIGSVYEQLYSIENLNLADKKARKGKVCQQGVKIHDKNREAHILLLHDMLKNKTYNTSAYTTFKIFEPKERIIYRLPYFPDRITHHAIMNVLHDMFVNCYIAHTYSCIKVRGIHAAMRDVKSTLQDIDNTKYCLKIDIKKFYPSIDHNILKRLLRRKIKDNDLLWLIDNIINSTTGLPIGNYMSQHLANFYLTYFDHWLKEEKKVKYYFRYADDIVILSNDKKYLHRLLSDMRQYLWINLKLEVKDNYQIFPVEKRGIDFVGYVFYHTHTLMRKSIKQNFARAIYNKKGKLSISSYAGWAKHCNSKNLLKKLINEAI